MVDPKKFKDHPSSVLYFSHLNNYRRKMIPEANTYHDDITDFNGTYSTVDNMVDSLDVQRFFDWCPSEHKEMMQMWYEGFDKKEIAKKLGYSRQTIHKRFNDVVKQYQNEVVQ